MIKKEDLIRRKIHIDKYERISTVFPSEVSSWRTQGVGVMDLLSSKADSETVA